MALKTVREILHAPEDFVGQSVELNGWVRTSRDVKACAFVELNDGSSVKNIQIVVDSASEFYTLAAHLNVGTSVKVAGEVIQSPNPQQPVEIKCCNIVIEGECPADYPLQKKRHSLEYLRTIQHLRPRTNLFNAVFRVRSVASFAIHKFFNDRGFVYAHTPITTANDAEGAGEMFRVTTLDLKKIALNDKNEVDFSKDFYEKETSLTVSGQLEAEIFALAFAKTYNFGPTFRAEKSNTPRHASEFWMIEPEIAFADLSDNMDLAEDMVKYIIQHVLENCQDEMEFLNTFVDKTLLDRLRKIAFEESFARITYTQAVELLEKNNDNFEFKAFWGCDLQTEHERYLAETVYKKPVFVTDYPKEIKAFYMRMNDDGKTVAACDLLAPEIGELIGGSQREERLDMLEGRIREMGMDPQSYWWYLELRKYGGTKHAGYGLGFDRMIRYLTGVANIRDVQPFIRTVGNAEF